MTTIATQTYGLGRELTADFEGTLEKLHAIGFDALETFILFRPAQGSTPKNLWTFEMLKVGDGKLKSLGMGISSAHIGIEFGGQVLPTAVIADNVRHVREVYGIRDFVISGHFGTPEAAKRWAGISCEIAAAIAQADCRLLYHNHDDEFRKLRQAEAEDAMEIYLAETGSQVFLEMDIGWAAMTGNELEIVERYAERIAIVHLKDFYGPFLRSNYTRNNVTQDAFAPIGCGAVATARVLAWLERLPNFTGSLVIDQDESGIPMLEALKTGYDNVKSML